MWRLEPQSARYRNEGKNLKSRPTNFNRAFSSLQYNFCSFVGIIFCFALFYLFVCLHLHIHTERAWSNKSGFTFIGNGLFMMNGIFLSLALLLRPFSSNWHNHYTTRISTTLIFCCLYLNLKDQTHTHTQLEKKSKESTFFVLCVVLLVNGLLFQLLFCFSLNVFYFLYELNR